MKSDKECKEIAKAFMVYVGTKSRREIVFLDPTLLFLEAKIQELSKIISADGVDILDQLRFIDDNYMYSFIYKEWKTLFLNYISSFNDDTLQAININRRMNKYPSEFRANLENMFLEIDVQNIFTDKKEP